MDPVYPVDPALATVTAATLTSKAFELTHVIHAEHRLAHGDADAAQRETEAREQRDVIVQELERRSDALLRSLAVVEAAERTIVRVLAGHFEQPDDPADALDAEQAANLLMEVASLTTDTTCSLVKSQDLSDAVSIMASDYGRRIRGGK